MTNKLRLSVSAAALSLLLAGGVSAAQAADVVAEPGCGLNGSLSAGYMYNWQDVSTDIDSSGIIGGIDETIDGNPEWQTPFAEGAALFTCDGLNIQGDFAWHDHSYDTKNEIFGKDDDLDQQSMHVGAALFYRDPQSFALGISGSKISQDSDLYNELDDKDPDIWRIGVFGEAYIGDVFTLGASAHYYSQDLLSDNEFLSKDEEGFELAAWGRFYLTPNLSLTVRGDLLLPDADFDLGDEFVEGPGFDINKKVGDGWAVSGEAEYLVWDNGLTVFGGARYAERSLGYDFSAGPIASFKEDSDIHDLQVYAGLKFYFDFGHERTLVEDHRSGAIDNTSVFHEKLPELFSSTIAGIDDAE